MAPSFGRNDVLLDLGREMFRAGMFRVGLERDIWRARQNRSTKRVSPHFRY